MFKRHTKLIRIALFRFGMSCHLIAQATVDTNQLNNLFTVFTLFDKSGSNNLPDLNTLLNLETINEEYQDDVKAYYAYRIKAENYCNYSPQLNSKLGLRNTSNTFRPLAIAESIIDRITA